MNRGNAAPSAPSGEPGYKDRIYERLKTDIIRCNLKPGLAISEAKLAARYDVGKAPVRDALSRLCHENLVISQPRRGHIIAPITIRDVIDLYEVRVILEPVAAKMAAGKVDEETLVRVAGGCEVPFTGDDPASVGSFLSANSEFHRTIAYFSGNQRLARQISNLLEDTERVRHIMVGSVLSQSDAIAEHAGLVDALIAGDGDAAAELSKVHIQRGWKLVMSTLVGQFQFMDMQFGGAMGEVHADTWLGQNLSVDVSRGHGSANVFKLKNTLGDERLDELSELTGKSFGDFPDAGKKNE